MHSKGHENIAIAMSSDLVFDLHIGLPARTYTVHTYRTVIRMRAGLQNPLVSRNEHMEVYLPALILRPEISADQPRT